MKYNSPDQVRSPREYAMNITPLYDGGEDGYSIAILEDCNGGFNIGIRWNISEKEKYDCRKTEEEKVCVGMPQSRGHSVWFILPDAFWRFVPQIINAEIKSGHNTKSVITGEQIQVALDNLINKNI